MKKLTTLIILLSSLFLFPSAKVSATEQMTCQEYTTEVKLTPLSLGTQSLVGTLCYRGTLTNKTLQLTVHGITYNRNYFDFSFNNYEYSYLRYAVDQGYAVFNIDRIGNGESDHPLGGLVNLSSSAYTIHQLIQKLRSGNLTGHAFDSIIYVGHSYGSFVGVELAADYPNDVDGVVLTGYLHNINPEALLVAPTALVPAQLDPKFGLTFPLGYLTTSAGMRDDLFYDVNLADPAVIAQDELEKDVFSITTVNDIVLATASTKSQNITKPTLIVIGENDFIFCHGQVDCSDPNAIQTHEAGYFSTSAELATVMIPGTGHDLNLHTNFLYTYEQIRDWLNQL